MFLLKMFKASKQKKYFHLNNFGKHLRDFTYIGDVINIIDKLIKRKIDKHEIFNICSNNPINIYKIVKNFQKFNFLKLKLVKLHKADVIKTHGDNRKIKKFIKIKKFSTFDKNFNNILQWYKKNNIDKL